MDNKILDNKSILIIDDDESFNQFLTLVLKKIGNFQIDAETDPQVGFNKILFYKPDLIILDIVMPGSDGINVGKAIDIIHDKGIPTIFISADRSYEKQIKPKHFQNVVTFLPKPIKKEVLEKTIVDVFTRALEKKRTPSESQRYVTYSRPLPLVIIALLHIFEPLSKILYFKASTEFPFSIVFNNILAIDNPKSFFEFWLLFPLAGAALLSVRQWAYIFFLLVQAYAIFLHLTYKAFTWPYISQSPLVSSSLLLAANVLLIIYFLIPAVRRPFFNRRLRWWETAPRFDINIPCTIARASGQLVDCRLVNLSKTGAFIRPPIELSMFESISIKFSFYNLTFALRARVVNKHTVEDFSGYGVKFKFVQFGSKWNMSKLIRALRVLHGQ
ncbi:MAG: hypothetical protein A2504_01795 [Bdellovibrionales bacterium RIFOXYD12_FULL_39_22]|nr:MAG: hypothetical protein A2385_04320 [Bdellovibrionales bacterium RIFOXYB1_FULL_39_21]OFZ42361.1 MAG: hypothetical protein A2485_15175 [Bdellovibrionales bacterium RIFOXYC12_FULL_39_17]OFZ46338.1 MAG: hypothetical protein A2404_13840 [Bdellovibrionales bacterium RIFOXYC1_FULL_39_130]OFZ73123.1 MAG: hypothetical protein A2451_06710 [Bdellovibrionales bacterium RIFOXYC2_FULL_39_8]OFZ75231.1 MAG: hypothetical protein A2560_15895 [Bdellovibrionales bacterium RIFOXYD1_FULL_39_84]OFZ93225.1 MAG: